MSRSGKVYPCSQVPMWRPGFDGRARQPVRIVDVHQRPSPRALMAQGLRGCSLPGHRRSAIYPLRTNRQLSGRHRLVTSVRQNKGPAVQMSFPDLSVTYISDVLQLYTQEQAPESDSQRKEGRIAVGRDLGAGNNTDCCA